MLDVVTNALQAHWSPYAQPHKPLTLSFHGWPGSGKNYVSTFIKDSLYLYGDKSIHVHHFMGRIHFPLLSRMEEYKASITMCIYIFEYMYKVNKLEIFEKCLELKWKKFEKEKIWLQNDIYQWVKSNVTKCPRQLFIFDEVDKIPPGTLNNLKPLMDYVKSVDKIDFRQAVFIFLSNTGGRLITDNILNLYNNGYRREDIRLSDFENIIAQGAFNEVGM